MYNGQGGHRIQVIFDYLGPLYKTREIIPDYF